MKTFIRVALSAAALGCGGGGAAVDPGTSSTPGGSPQPTIASVTVTPPTASVAVSATIQLSAVPRDQSGADISGLTPTWSSSNEAIARVSATGIVTGVSAGTATVTATVTAAGQTKSSTSQVIVTAPGAPAPPGPSTPTTATVSTPGASFSPAAVTIGVGGTVTWQFSGATHNVSFGAAKPDGGDIPDTSPGANVSRTFSSPGSYTYQCTRHSGMTGQVTVQASGPAGQFAALTLTPPTAFVIPGGSVQLTATARDGAGAVLSALGAPIFMTSNSAVATVSSSGLVTAVANGTASIIASLTANGVTRADTSAVTVGAPAATVTTTGDVFAPEDIEIAPGGTVVWQFAGTHNVTFKDDAPPDGHIPTSGAGTSAARTFPVEGSYDYHCTLHDGMRGRIRVR